MQLLLLLPPLAGQLNGGDAHAHAHTERVKILVMDLAAEGPVDDGTVKTLTGILSAELATYPELDVMANADVKRMVELEGQKQSVGCGDTSCLADIAGALGAELVVFGSVGKLGEALVLHLNLYDSTKAESVGRQFLEAKDVSALPSLLAPKLRALLHRTYLEKGLVMPPAPEDLPPPPPPPPPEVSEGPGALPFVLIGGGVVVAAGGGVAAYFGSNPYFIYQGQVARFRTARADGDVKLAGDLRDNSLAQADAWNTWGLPTAAAGAVGVVGGVVAIGVGTAQLLFAGD